MNSPATTSQEPTMSMPTGRLVGAIIGACVVSAAGWMGAIALGPWDRELMMIGPISAGLVAVVGGLGVLVMSPWKTREMSLWWTMWLGATVLRLLLTPAAAFVLYSATSLNPTALCLAIAASYFLALMTEAAVIARHVNRVLYPQ